jgi:hypothetical protein
MAVPLTSTSPCDGVRRPAMIFNSVVLLDPLGPTITTVSPPFTPNVTRSRAMSGIAPDTRKVFTRSCTVSDGESAITLTF